MPQLKPALDYADRFDRDYPDALPDRLEWLATHLALDRERLLRLLGLSCAQVRAYRRSPWKIVAQKWPDQASRVEQLLCIFLAAHNYDWEAAAKRLHPVAAVPQAEGDGDSGPDADLPHFRVLPPDSDRDTVLLTLIAEGGPSNQAALVKFFAQPRAASR